MTTVITQSFCFQNWLLNATTDGAKDLFHVLSINVPLASVFEGGGISSFITVMLYTENLEEVNKWRKTGSTFLIS